MLDEDDNDVFSNPDTAELESSRSDATGATSPAPNSPGPSSPVSRAGIVYLPSHQMGSPTSMATTAVGNTGAPLPSSDHFATMKQQQNLQSSQDSSQTRQGVPMLNLGSLPPARFEQSQQQQQGQGLGGQGQGLVQTPKPTTTSSTAAASRPQFGRTVSASGLPHRMGSQATSAAMVASPSQQRMHGHSPSLSASQVSLSHSGQLPSAHGLPSDPKEAMTLSKLFAHPPAQSPAEEMSGFLLTPHGGGGIHMRPSFSAAESSSAATTPLVGAASQGHFVGMTPPPSSSRFLSRTRPSSPDRLGIMASPSRSRSVVAGMAGLPASMTASSPNAPTASGDFGVATETGSHIFERDIEHRDSHHVMSKQEAVDVAIPSVLDDAVEAITSEDADQLEIVAPHAAPAPLALSAQALSAHSHVQAVQASSTSSPISSPSPPLSSAGGVEQPPPGTMAAQIAERLVPNSRAATAVAPGSTHQAKDEQGTVTQRFLHHRRPNSDVSISSNSSMRSRPQHSTTIGVQQVLDQSPSPPMRPNRILGSSALSSPSPGLMGHAHTKSASSSIGGHGAAIAPKSGSGSHTNVGSLASASAAGTLKGHLPTATQLPSLPMPNPYRPSSPGLGAQPLFANDNTGVSIVPSLSMDGAVMPSNESATKDASLAGLADAITSPSSSSASGVHAATHAKGLGLDDGIGLQHLTASIAAASIDEPSPYGSRSPRSPQSTMTASPKSPASPLVERRSRATPQHSTSFQMPGSMPSSSFAETDAGAVGGENASSVSASPSLSKKRLSFFSYADIINKTPAEVIDFDAATRGAGAPYHGTSHIMTGSSSGDTAFMARSQSAGPRSP